MQLKLQIRKHKNMHLLYMNKEVLLKEIYNINYFSDTSSYYNILTEYKQNCIPALNMSTECLQLSGLDTTEFFKALESIYTKLNERITEFSDFLTNTVAVEV